MINSLSEAYGAHHLHAHHVTPLDFDLVRSELPDSHAWHYDGPCSMISTTTSPTDSSTSQVPVIDLIASKKNGTAKQLVGSACKTWGTFQVTNHGVPLPLLENVESQCRRLFSLPTKQKLEALRSPGQGTGYGLPRISPFFSKLMWHEGFTIMGSLVEQAHKLWPFEYTNFCEVMEKYEEEMKKLAEELLELMVESLGIRTEDVNHHQWEAAHTALQLNSYPACPDPKRAMGLAPHTDNSLFTILYQSRASTGLQILRDGVDDWVPVPPLHGALTVNVGDLLHIISNARFPTVMHRAIVNQTHHRYSVAYFYGPPINAHISPLVSNIKHGDDDHGEAPRYRPITRREYIDIKAKSFNEALSLIRL